MTAGFPLGFIASREQIFLARFSGQEKAKAKEKGWELSGPSAKTRTRS